jgi:hypothetical protein
MIKIEDMARQTLCNLDIFIGGLEECSPVMSQASAADQLHTASYARGAETFDGNF